MPSKRLESAWPLWDFFYNHPFSINPEQYGIYSFSIFSPWVANFLEEHLPPKKEFNLNWRKKCGSDITIEWLEEEFFTPSLFAALDSIWIYQAELMPKHVRDYFVEQSWNIGDRYLILIFSQENNLTQQLMKSSKEFDLFHFNLTAPRFWEFGKVLEFLLKRFKIRLSYSAQQVFLEMVNPTLDDYIMELKKLELNYQEVTEVSEQALKEVLNVWRIDNFKLVELYARKEKKAFFSQVLKLNLDFDDWKSLLQLMQSHFAKLLYPEFLKNKSRPTKYDKEIEFQSKLWSKEELIQEINFLLDLEIQVRKKDSNLTLRLESVLTQLY